MQDKISFFGGVPTSPDVKRIREVFPDAELTPGMRIGYSEIQNIIGEKPTSSRWRTVTNQWRKVAERDSSIIIGCDGAAKAFYVLTEPQKVEYMRDKNRSAGRSARRAFLVGAIVDVNKLDEEHKRLHAFHADRGAKILQLGQVRSDKKQLPEV